MNTPGHYALTYFGTEGEEAQAMRQEHNIQAAHVNSYKKAKGIDRFATAIMGPRMSKTAMKANVAASAASRSVLCMPCVAGVVEIDFWRIARTTRSEELWDICRQALEDGSIEDMAREMGIDRPQIRLLDRILKLMREEAPGAAPEAIQPRMV